MFATREHTRKAVKNCTPYELIEYAANGTNIPLQKENWSNRWCTLPIYFKRIFKDLYEFPIRDDDVFVVTFPRSGTTWTQEATWLLVNDLDFKSAKTSTLKERSVFMDLTGLHVGFPFDSVEASKLSKPPRVLKSHLPAHLIPREIWDKKVKIIYCARNPKDVAVSFYHCDRGLGGWQGDLDDFVDHLINDDITYSPYWEHIMDFWQMRKEPNICFITYEDMKRDLKQVLIKVNHFLEKPELSEDNLDKLEKHLLFDNLKFNEFVNPTESIKSNKGYSNVSQDFQFMRRGIVGSYKKELSEEADLKLNLWIEQKLKKFNVQLQDIFGDL